MREQDYIADVGAVGEQHHQSVDAYAFAGSWWQAVFQRTHEIIVLEHRFFVARIFGCDLRIETCFLIFRVVQFGEAIGDLAADDEQLEAFCDLGVRIAATGQRGDFDWVVDDEGWLEQVAFCQLLE